MSHSKCNLHVFGSKIFIRTEMGETMPRGSNNDPESFNKFLFVGVKVLLNLINLSKVNKSSSNS